MEHLEDPRWCHAITSFCIFHGWSGTSPPWPTSPRMLPAEAGTAEVIVVEAGPLPSSLPPLRPPLSRPPPSHPLRVATTPTFAAPASTPYVMIAMVEMSVINDGRYRNWRWHGTTWDPPQYWFITAILGRLCIVFDVGGRHRVVLSFAAKIK